MEETALAPRPAAELENARGETASTALAQRAKSEVEARYVMALRQPRKDEDSRQRILNHCKRKRFAEAAQYAKPVGGKKIVGPSIRFVETALAEWRNVDVQAAVTFEDSERLLVSVVVTDLESNVTHRAETVIAKTVERKSLKRGEQAISSRVNSQGEMTYLLPATADDILNKTNAAASKMIRNCGLRVLPRDIVDEAIDACNQTVRAEIERDPTAERRRVLDAFGKIGIRPSDLEAYLGHSIDQVSPAELQSLRVVYATVDSGEATWRDVVQAAQVERGEVEEDVQVSKGAQRLREKLEEKKKPNPGPAARGPVDRDSEFKGEQQ
jgi:hypothetical protein